MEIEEQVIGIELATRLKRLGAKQESYFVWYKGELMPRTGISEVADESDTFAAFTSQELGWMLPKAAMCEGVKIYLGMDKHFAEWEIWYENGDGSKWKDCYASTTNEAYNRGYILAILLENKATPE